MADKTIIFRTYDTLPEAQFVKDALLQNGIQSFIANQLGAQLYALFSFSSAGGYNLMILDEDLKKAEDILAGLESQDSKNSDIPEAGDTY